MACKRARRVARHSPPQHVALLCVLENQHQLVDTVHLVFDALDERAERVGDVVDERIADPIGRDRDVVLEVLDTSPDVLGMRRAPKVELKPSAAAVSIALTESVPSRKTIMYMLSGSR